MRSSDRYHFAAVAISFALLTWLMATPASAQTPAPDKPKATSTRAERAAAQAARRKQMMERDAAVRAKRAACLEERKEKKVPLLDRPRFIRECMARK